MPPPQRKATVAPAQNLCQATPRRQGLCIVQGAQHPAGRAPQGAASRVPCAVGPRAWGVPCRCVAGFGGPPRRGAWRSRCPRRARGAGSAWAGGPAPPRSVSARWAPLLGPGGAALGPRAWPGGPAAPACSAWCRGPARPGGRAPGHAPVGARTAPRRGPARARARAVGQRAAPAAGAGRDGGRGPWSGAYRPRSPGAGRAAPARDRRAAPRRPCHPRCRPAPRCGQPRRRPRPPRQGTLKRPCARPCGLVPAHETGYNEGAGPGPCPRARR